MKAGDLVKIKHEGWFQHNGTTHLVTKVEVQRGRVVARLLGFSYRVEKEHLVVLNENR
jgi:hypothetical protein